MISCLDVFITKYQNLNVKYTKSSQVVTIKNQVVVIGRKPTTSTYLVTN